MPIFDVTCDACGYSGELIALGQGEVTCPECGSANLAKRMSATSSLTGKSGPSHPGPGDTAYCGSTPSQAGCAGPGSCCGRPMGGGS